MGSIINANVLIISCKVIIISEFIFFAYFASADIFEALMGAIYIDLGYATARNTILRIIVPYIEDPNINFFSDYKSSLQEMVQTDQKSLEYNLINEEGPAHDKRFTVEVRIDDIVYGIGIGTTKKEAEQAAAKEALEKMAK